MITGYVHQNEQFSSVAQQREDMVLCAESYHLGGIKFVEIPADKTILSCPIKKKKTIIIPNLSLIGTKFEDVITALRLLSAYQVCLYSAKEGLAIDIERPHSFSDNLDVCLRIYKGILSLKNARIQADLLKQGKPRGRPYNNKQGKSTLDDRKAEILALLKKNLSFSEMAKSLGVCRSTLYMYIKRKGLKEA